MKKPDLLRFDFLPADAQKRLQNAIVSQAVSSDETSLRDYAFDLQKHDARSAATLMVVSDLLRAEWKLVPSMGGSFSLEKPSSEAKADVQRSLRAAGADWIKSENSQKFITKLLAPRKHGERQASILDLIDDGKSLANGLASCEDKERLNQIKPEIVLVEPGVECSETGIDLRDVWRFMRYFWSIEYKSVPGRSMAYLIRNAARPNSPIMGIGMLASPVVQFTARDNEIEWSSAQLIDRINSGKKLRSLAKHYWSRYRELWGGLLVDDFLGKPVTHELPLKLDKQELDFPTNNTFVVIDRIVSLAQAQSKEETPERIGASALKTKKQCRAQAGTWMYVKKRAELLRSLLNLQAIFVAHGFTGPNAEALRYLASTKDGRSALSWLQQRLRSEAVSSQIIDLTTCGAIPPYNELLAGKLVALAALSDDIQKAYSTKYGSMPSIIASCMAGRPIKKDTFIEIVTTTSLYGTGSSQYNRLKLRSADFEDLDYDLVFGKWGESKGFGTFGFSLSCREALYKLADELAEKGEAPAVDFVFGQGVSPTMRKLRIGLTALNIGDPNIFLKHESKRLLYGSYATPSSKERLLGMSSNDPEEKPSFEEIANAWLMRWASSRTRNQDVMVRIADFDRHELVDSILTPQTDLD